MKKILNGKCREKRKDLKMNDEERERRRANATRTRGMWVSREAGSGGKWFVDQRHKRGETRDPPSLSEHGRRDPKRREPSTVRCSIQSGCDRHNARIVETLNILSFSMFHYFFATLFRYLSNVKDVMNQGPELSIEC